MQNDKLKLKNFKIIAKRYLNFDFYTLIFTFARREGVVALSVTLLLSAVIVEIAVIGSIVAYTLTNSNYSARLSAEAAAAAKAGLEDALLRLTRDKHFGTNPGYNLIVGGQRAEVIVCRDSKTVSAPCDTAGPGQDEITSTGYALTKKQALRALVAIDPLSGETRLVSVREITL